MTRTHSQSPNDKCNTEPSLKADLADLINIIYPMLKIVYPCVQLRVISFALSKTLRVVGNNSNALVCPALVDYRERFQRQMNSTRVAKSILKILLLAMAQKLAACFSCKDLES